MTTKETPMLSKTQPQPLFSSSWWSSLLLSQIINYQLVLSTGWSPTEKRNQHQRHHLLLRNWDRVSFSWWQRRWCFIGRRWTNNVVNVLRSYCWCCCWWCCRLPQLMAAQVMFVMIMISMAMLMIDDDDWWRWVAVALKISWVSLAFACKTLPIWSPESELLI